LFLVRNPLLGKALISSPFAVYGGILADSAEARDALYGYVKGLGKELGVDYIELRNAWPEQCGEISNVSRYVTFTQELAPDEAKLLESLPKKTLMDNHGLACLRSKGDPRPDQWDRMRAYGERTPLSATV
jgi:hypothetical protein